MKEKYKFVFSASFSVVLFLQSVSAAEVGDRGHGEEARESHHASNRGRRKRRGHDPDGPRRGRDQWKRGHAGHQLF